MTVNIMSSAPANTTHDSTCDEYEDIVDQQTEAFLAGCMYDTTTDTDYCYTSSGDGPVQITANMLSDDDIWLLHSDTALPPARTAAFNPSVPMTSQPAVFSIQSPSFPTNSTPLSYLVAFRADLATLKGIELHETRIY